MITTEEIPRTRDPLSVVAKSHVDYALIPHRPTLTAKDEAEAVGVAPQEVAKTVVVRTEAGYARVVVPASDRVDLAKVRDVLGTNGKTRLATEGELVAAYPDFELGAVPPFGGPAGDAVVVDRKLAGYERLVFEAGTHKESLRLKTEDLLQLAEARIGDVCQG